MYLDARISRQIKPNFRMQVVLVCIYRNLTQHCFKFDKNHEKCDILSFY